MSEFGKWQDHIVGDVVNLDKRTVESTCTPFPIAGAVITAFLDVCFAHGLRLVDQINVLPLPMSLHCLLVV